MPQIWHVTAITLLLFVAPWPSNAAERRQWVTFTTCQYVAAKDNDGDSFRVRCGTDEFNLRLYFGFVSKNYGRVLARAVFQVHDIRRVLSS